VRLGARRMIGDHLLILEITLKPTSHGKTSARRAAQRLISQLEHRAASAQHTTRCEARAVQSTSVVTRAGLPRRDQRGVL